MAKEKKKETDLIAVIVAMGTIGYLIFAILTSNLSEAVRYFIINLIFLLILIAYIELSVKKAVIK